MIDVAILLPYVLACLLFSIVPGPSVTAVVANSLAAGRAREVPTAARVRLMSRVSGVILVFGGVWLALQRRA